MIGTDLDAIAENKVGSDVNDWFGHGITPGSFQGIAIELLDFADVAVVRPGAKRGPTFLFIAYFGGDGGQACGPNFGQNVVKKWAAQVEAWVIFSLMVIVGLTPYAFSYETKKAGPKLIS